MILLWLTIAKALFALAPAELKILRTNMRTEVAIDKSIQRLLMQRHKYKLVHDVFAMARMACLSQLCHNKANRSADRVGMVNYEIGAIGT